MITISNLNTFDKSTAKYLKDCEDAINMSMADPDFKASFLAAKFTETHKMTNEAIFAKLCEDQEIEIYIYRSWWSKVLGYFTSGDAINLNTKYFGSKITTASCIFHEFSHKQGFSHYYTWSSSVPYSINRLFEAWANRKGI